MSMQSLREYVFQYGNANEVFANISHLMETYQGLVVQKGLFVFCNGPIKDLFKLRGTIPVPYGGKSYNIPICVWLMDTHLLLPPICVLEPTVNMVLREVRNVGQDCKINLPYLDNWNPSNCNLVELVQEMIYEFGKCLPVSAKPAHETNASSSHSTQDYTTIRPLNVSYPPYPIAQSNVSVPCQNVRYQQHPLKCNMLSVPPRPAQPSNYPGYPPSPAVSTALPSTSSLSNLVTSASSLNSTGTITEEHLAASLKSVIEGNLAATIPSLTSFSKHPNYKSKPLLTIDDYELMRRICLDLMNKGILKVKEIVDVVDILVEFRSESSTYKEKKKKDDESARFERMSRDSDSSNSSMDYPEDESTSSSSISESSPNSSFSQLFSDARDPATENRNLTSEEIDSLNKDLKLLLDFGTPTQKSCLLAVLQGINFRFAECVWYYIG